MNDTVDPRQQLQVRQKNVIDFFRKHEDKITGALAGTALTPERMMNVLYNAVRVNPKLANCNLKSLYGAAVRCAQVGLEPDDGRGLAYFIPFKDQVQVIFGYKGLCQLTYNTGLVSGIEAHIVHEQDEFRYAYGLDPVLVHIPASSDRGPATHVYGIVRWRDKASPAWLVMSMEEVYEIRDRFSRGYKDFLSGRVSQSTWDPANPVTSGEMAKKTVLRRLLKLCPTSTHREMALAIALDETAEQAQAQHNSSVIDLDTWSEVNEGEQQAVPPQAAQSGADAVAEKVRQCTAKKPSAVPCTHSLWEWLAEYKDGELDKDIADEKADFLRTLQEGPDALNAAEYNALLDLIEIKRSEP